MANNWLNNQRLPKRPERPGMPMYAGMQEPGELTLSRQPPGGKDEWLKRILKVVLPLMAGGAMVSSARGVKAPHGGTVGSKPLMAQALHTLAKTIESKQKAKEELEQAMEEKRATSEQEQWDREWKAYQESQITRRKKMGILSAEKIAGMRAEPEVLSEAEIENQRLKNEKLKADIKATNALTHERYQNAKNAGNKPLADLYKFPTSYSKYETVEGSELYMKLWATYHNAIDNNDRIDFDAIENEITATKEAMFKERQTLNMFGQTVTITGAKDHSNLTSAFRWMKGALDKAKIKTKVYKPEELPGDQGGLYQPEQSPKIMEMREAFYSGNVDEATRIANELGLTPEQFAEYIK